MSVQRYNILGESLSWNMWDITKSIGRYLSVLFVEQNFHQDRHLWCTLCITKGVSNKLRTKWKFQNLPQARLHSWLQWYETSDQCALVGSWPPLWEIIRILPGLFLKSTPSSSFYRDHHLDTAAPIPRTRPGKVQSQRRSRGMRRQKAMIPDQGRIIFASVMVLLFMKWWWWIIGDIGDKGDVLWL